LLAERERSKEITKAKDSRGQTRPGVNYFTWTGFYGARDSANGGRKKGRKKRKRRGRKKKHSRGTNRPLLLDNLFPRVIDELPPSHFSTFNQLRKQGKDGPEEKKDADGELWGNVEAQAAFLGPNLWDKTLPYDADLKYVDLDEFLSENGIPVDGVAGGGQGTMQSGQLHKINNTETPGHQGPAGLHLEPVTKRERSPSPSECCSPDTMNPPSPADSTLSMASSGRDFDPRTRAFSDEELKPQPMIKKSRKQVSGQITRALISPFLNMGLRQELDRLKNENMLLRDKLSKYTDV
ncbi:hepatic leukemia factor-like, partial [Frieseomelitta varia]|uniref:hepatic leukemia factor-like n=1 Tax=Frieseomelitta varia TaxID=561572 RepID=UPI001CB68FB1